MAKNDDRFNQKIEAIQRYNRELQRARQLDEEILEDLQDKLKAQNEEINNLEALSTAQKELIRLEKEQTEAALNHYKSKLKEEEKLQKKLGITGALFKGMEKSLSKLGMNDKHFKKINKEMRAAAKNGNGMTAALKGFTTQAKILGQGILKDPAIQAGIITSTFKKGKKILEFFDKEAFKLQGTLGLSWKESNRINQNLLKGANTIKGIKSTYNELVQSQIELSNYTKTDYQFSVKELDSQMKLVKLTGLTVEQAAKYREISDVTGETTGEIMETITSQNTGLMSNKALLQEVADIGGEIRSDYQGNVKELSKAVIQTHKLGISLKQAKNMSRGLLDFEASIEAEMEAELLSGKNINLEKARYLAMQGKSGEAAAEMLKNIGGIHKFEKMNTLEKDAYAKAMNMNSEELATALYKEEQLNKLGAKKKKALLEQVALLKKQGKVEEANYLMANAEKGKTLKETQQQFTTVEEGKRQIEKAKIAMMSGLAKPMQKVGDLLNKFFTYMDNNPWLKTALKGIGAAAALIAVGASIVAGAKMISNLFTGGIGKMFGGKLGSSRYNYMWTRDVDGGGGGDMMSNMMQMGSRWTKSMKIFKNASKLFGGKSTMMGRGMRNLAAMFGKRSSFANQIVKNSKFLSKMIPSMSKLTSKIPGFSKVGSTGATVASKTSFLGKAGSALSKGGGKLLSGAAKGLKALGPIGAIADVAIGGFTGYQASKLTKSQKKAQGIREDMGAGAATTLGVLTGDASKGSSLSKYVGVKKGGAGDEAMGVAGSAGRGALVGAAVGSVVPVVGTAIGAVAGGIIGAGSELVKVFSDPNSKLRKGVSNFATGVKDKIGESFSYVKDKFTSFGSSLKKGASSLAEGGKKAGKMFLNVNKKLITGGLDMSKKLFKGGVSAIKSIIPKSVTSKVKNVAEKGKDLLKKGLNFLGFANGGITSGGFSPIEAFANGGIVKKPTIGIIGEAGMNEAMVPLPDGKNIPVKMNDNTNNKSLEAKFDKLINVLASHPEIKVNLELDGTKLIDQLSIQR